MELQQHLVVLGMGLPVQQRHWSSSTRQGQAIRSAGCCHLGLLVPQQLCALLLLMKSKEGLLLLYPTAWLTSLMRR